MTGAVQYVGGLAYVITIGAGTVAILAMYVGLASMLGELLARRAPEVRRHD